MSASPRVTDRPALPSARGPRFLIVISLVLVAALGVVGAVRDLALARRALLSGELSAVRSHAERTVGGIETHLEENAASGDVVSNLRTPWLREYWRKAVQQRDERLYAAVVSADGRILVHSDSSKEGGRLEEDWRGRPARVDAVEAFHCNSPALSGGEPAVDVALPVSLRGAEIGVYHVGLSMPWFEEFAARRLRPVVTGWVVVIVAIAIVVAAASAALTRLLRRQAELQLRLGEQQARRFAERQQLLVGLAHEIRNPLNAIQINLHVLKREFASTAVGARSAIETMISESAEEVERIDELIREVMGLAAATANDRAVEDVGMELQALREFVGEMLSSNGVELTIRAPSSRLAIPLGRPAFRQVMLNLVENARCALEGGGRIDIDVRVADGTASITVSDNGPGVPEDLQDRLFEPFFTTRERGLGLGLAIVRKHLEEVGGSVAYDPPPRGGARFVVTMPLGPGAT